MKRQRFFLTFIFLINFSLSVSFGGVIFQGLDNLIGGSYFSEVYDVSGDGTIVVLTSYTGDKYENFVWNKTTGMIRTGITFMPYSISKDGTTVVGSARSADWRAYKWTQQGGITELRKPAGSDYSFAVGCNFDGSKIVGNVDDSSGIYPYPKDMACVWVNGNPIVIGEGRATNISVNGKITGFLNDSESHSHPFYWTDNEGQIFLPVLNVLDSEGIPVDISANGEIIVGWSGWEVEKQAVMWKDNSIIKLGSLAKPGYVERGVAMDISADGYIIVGSSNVYYNDEAFIWDASNGMRNLKDILIKDYGLNLDNWWLEEAIAVSDDGLTIVGNGRHYDQPEAWIVTIPEPATLLLLGLGGLFLRKRK